MEMITISNRREDLGSKYNYDSDDIDNASDVESIGSSIEMHDAAINESWDWASVQRRLRQRENASWRTAVVAGKHRHIPDSVRVNIEDHHLEQSLRRNLQQETWLGALWRWWNERSINARLANFDEEEQRSFIAQRMKRVIAIFENETSKESLSKTMLCSKTKELIHRDDSWAQLMRREYGSRMTEWILFYAQQIEPRKNQREKKVRKIAMKKTSELERMLSSDVNDNFLTKYANDPLVGWFRQRWDVSGRMLARIQNLAESISQRVSWSFLIEPGRPRTDLSKFIAEFDVLEGFFDKVELMPDEYSQKAFDANSLFKVRNRKLACVDWSRVVLTAQAEFVAHQEGNENSTSSGRPQPANIFGDFDCPQISTRTEFGHGDFINASFIRGGPLLNTFILTQTPLQQTIPDFWRMVWQQRSEWIFMLSEATDSSMTENIVVGSAARTHCPFYWPRFEGDVLRFGLIFVKNISIDSAADPLFNITHLELWLADEADKDRSNTSAKSERKSRSHQRRLRLQLWQWDWRNYTDFQWPFRILIRARHSKRPTILMCADGCGRSGTLALIEIFLMQLLRGAVSLDYPMLTAAVFLRLQRRHAIANHMQYLYAYRAVLHWLQPFVISWYHRLVLGFTSHIPGFCAKYDEIAHTYAHKKSLLV